MSTQAQQNLVSQMEEVLKTKRLQMLPMLCKVWMDIFGSNCNDALMVQMELTYEQFFLEVIKDNTKKRDKLIRGVAGLDKELHQHKELLKDFPGGLSEDVPLYQRCQKIKSEVENFRKQKQHRMTKFMAMKQEAEEVKKALELSTTRFDQDPKDLSMKALDELASYLEELKSEKIARSKKMESLQCQLYELFELLSPVDMTDIDLQELQSKTLQPTAENENKLVVAVKILNEIQNSRQERIANAKKKLEGPNGLWMRLDVPIKHQRLVLFNLSLKESTVERLEAEIDRCHEREEFLRVLPDTFFTLSEEIVKLLEKTKLPKAESVLYDAKVVTEEYLDSMKLELAHLQKHYEENKIILDLVEERAKVKAQHEAVLHKQAESQNRLKNRGGQLLKDEQERKPLEHKLMAIEVKIFKAATNYQKTHRKPFLIDGKPIDADPTAENKMKFKRMNSLTDLRLKKPLGNSTNV